MVITINGTKENIEALTLAALLSKKNLKLEAIVVEHNQKIIPRSLWQDVRLLENDTIEIVSFVGGG